MLWMDQTQEGVTMGECVCVSYPATKRPKYSGKKKYVNPLELVGFLHYHLIFIKFPSIEKHNVLMLLTHELQLNHNI